MLPPPSHKCTHIHVAKVLPLVAFSSDSEVVLVVYLRLAVLGGGGRGGGALLLDFEPSEELAPRLRLPRRLNLLYNEKLIITMANVLT